MAVEDVKGEPETVECVHNAIASLDESLGQRIVILPGANRFQETSPLVGEVASLRAGGNANNDQSAVDNPPTRRQAADLPHKGGGGSDSPLHTPHPSLPTPFTAADLFICQPFSQPRSKAALTALALGVPIIGSRFMEHADLMHVSVTGLEVAELDPKSLAKALTELLPDEKKRQEMGRQSRSWLASRASVGWVRKQWAAVLEEAAELRIRRAGYYFDGDPAENAERSDPARLQGILTTTANDRS